MTGGGSQNTVSQTSVPAWLQPYLTGNLNTAQGLENTGQFAGTPTPVAPLSSLQTQGLNSVAGVNPTSISAANNAVTGVENGQYLQPAQTQMSAASPSIANEASGSLMSSQNPYLGAEYTQGLQGIQNNVDSQFGSAGRNVLASAPVQADQASTLATDLYGGAYNTNLTATQNAQSLASGNYNSGVTAVNQGAGVAPGVTEGLYAPGQADLSAGQTQQTQAQNVANAPYNTLSWYSSLLSGSASPFGSSTSSTSNAPNQTATDVGLGLGAAGLGASIYGLMAGAAMA